MATNSYIAHDGAYIAYGKRTIPNAPIGGGGGGGYPLIAETSFEVSTSSTTAEVVGTYAVTGVAKGDMFHVQIRDREGRRTGYFIGSDTLCCLTGTSNYTDNYTIADVSGVLVSRLQGAGFYVNYISFDNNDKMTIGFAKKYTASTTGTVDSTYEVKVYKIDEF